MSVEHRAVLYSATPPTPEQEKRLLRFIARRYGAPLPLIWKAADMPRGFRLELADEAFDWTPEGQLRQLENCMDKVLDEADPEADVLPLLEDAIGDFSLAPSLEETGEVLYVGDEIARVGGLPDAQYGEILDFSGPVKGLVLDLREDSIGCVLFGDMQDVAQGSLVRRTGRSAVMPVGFSFLGRVVDALGRPIDGKGPIRPDGYRPIECEAPSILDRESVKTPLETGILCVDSMFPIGRGQRELIVGDRQTGKTSLAVDTILNQRGKRVICIYCAVGQKTGSVARLANHLELNGAMEYTIILNAGAGDPASEQYLAPFSATALGEYFMHLGRDVLIVYDDLSKHAVAYRTLSLLLDRSPGREAYPGDVFYLHSRLLERSARLRSEAGGGSLTALPIVETQAGDVSAYGRPALSGFLSLPLRTASGGGSGSLRFPRGRRRPDQGDEKGHRQSANRAGPVPGNGGLHPLFLRSGSLRRAAAALRRASDAAFAPETEPSPAPGGAGGAFDGGHGARHGRLAAGSGESLRPASGASHGG